MTEKDEEKEEESGSAADDEFGGVQVWSTDSEDDEVRKPSHGKAYVARGDESSGECLMVTDVSQMRGYNTDGGKEDTKERDDLCFTIKPLSV
ncbi:hypothetical protein Lser_V15G23598 [Lactuca serriola]